MLHPQRVHQALQRILMTDAIPLEDVCSGVDGEKDSCVVFNVGLGVRVGLGVGHAETISKAGPEMALKSATIAGARKQQADTMVDYKDAATNEWKGWTTETPRSGYGGEP